MKASPASRTVRSLSEFPPQFWLLTAGILVYVIGVDMCFPFETLFLNGRLHISMTVVGLLLGITGLAGLPFQVLGGAFADRFGRRGVLVLAVCGSAVLYVGLGLSHTLAEVVVVVSIEAAFGWAMFLTGSNAMIADLTVAHRRAEAFGLSRTAINVGMIVGPLIALAFLGRGPGFRPLFVVGGAVCLSFLVVILGGLRETKPGGGGGAPRPRPHPVPGGQTRASIRATAATLARCGPGLPLIRFRHTQFQPFSQATCHSKGGR